MLSTHHIQLSGTGRSIDEYSMYGDTLAKPITTMPRYKGPKNERPMSKRDHYQAAMENAHGANLLSTRPQNRVVRRERHAALRPAVMAHPPILAAPTAISAAERIQQHTKRRAKHFSLQPIRLVPTMSPFEVAHIGRKQLPALHLAVLAECNALVRQGAPVEHLLQHTTTDNTNWWVLVSIAPQAVRITALLRYRTPDMRLQAMRFDAIEGTAHFYPADMLEPMLKRMDGTRNPNERIGQFLRDNYRASFQVIGQEDAAQCTVISTLQGQPFMGTWHKAHDMVCYHESHAPESVMPALPGHRSAGCGG